MVIILISVNMYVYGWERRMFKWKILKNIWSTVPVPMEENHQPQILKVFISEKCFEI